MEVNRMPEKNFKCLEFDDENKRLNILIGNVLLIMTKLPKYLF